MATSADPGSSTVQIDGSAVRRCRRARLWTQQELADACGLTVRSIKSIERSGGGRRADTLRALAEALGVEPAHLQGSAPSTDLVGRDRERARLDECFSDAERGLGRVLLVAGEAGAGKTTLIEDLARRARERGAWTRVGRCGEDDGAAPYRPWVQMLRASTRDLDLAGAYERGELGASGADLARLVPECLPVGAGSALPASPERYPLFEAVCRWWSLCAERAAQVLVVEDLHAADRSTLQVWQHVAEQVRELRILLVGTYRHTEVGRGHALLEVVEQLDRIPGYDRVELGGLRVEHVAQLAGARLPQRVEPDFSAALHARTAGNPFFVGELLRHVEAAEVYTAAQVPQDLPPRVHDAVRARVGRLAAGARELLEHAAVIGRGFSLGLLSGVSAGAEEELPGWLDTAVWAGVVRVSGSGVDAFEFTHDIFRDALYEQIPASRKAALHRRVAEALERLGGDEASASALAHHWVRAGAAGDAKRAYAHVVAAAQEANGRLAYEEAAAYWAQAQALAASAGHGSAEEACRLLLARAQALNRAGDAGATDAFHAAAQRAREAGSAQLLAEAALGVGLRFGQITEFGHFDPRQASLLEEALEALPEAPSAERAQVLARLSMSLYWSEQTERSVAMAEEAVVVARTVGDPTTLAVTLMARHMSLLRLETPTGRAEVLSEASAELARVDHPELCLELETLHLVEAMDSAERSDHYGPALARYAVQAERLGQAQGRWWTSALQTGVALAEGRMAEAIEGIERTRAIGLRSRNTNVENTYGAQTWLRLVHERDWPGLRQLSGDFTQRYPMLRTWRCIHTFALACCGDRDGALFHLRELSRNDFRPIRQPALWGISGGMLASTCHRIAAHEEGERLHELLLPHERRNAIVGLGVGYLGPISLYLGQLDLLLDRHVAAKCHLRAALARTRGLGAHPWTAMVLLELAELRIRTGQPDLARQHLEEAARCASAVGLAALAAEARSRLARVGAATAGGPV